jgi:polysaccharide pyruvyl transferase CsaB
LTASLGNKLNLHGRNLILLSGYYGFSNLGDEAILETITDQLKSLGWGKDVVVLSNTPEATEKTFGVAAADRWKLGPLMKLFPHTKLFISGGGGLFQDRVSMRSPLFYGAQITLSTLCGSEPMIFAQGVGPIDTTIGRMVTRGAFSLAEYITVRDQDSFDLLKSWNLEPVLTADPVWALTPKPLPDKLETWRKNKRKSSLRVGLSLRTSNNFSADALVALVEAMARALPENATVVPLSLHPEQDDDVLRLFTQEWIGLGRKVESIDTSTISLPSQWLGLLSCLDLVVAMRLHCNIMALSSGVPTVPIAYDAKVAHVAKQFELPTLHLTEAGLPEGGGKSWNEALKSAVENRKALAVNSSEKAKAARNMACQNFEFLAKILGSKTAS